jgi:hypothetical protein
MGREATPGRAIGSRSSLPARRFSTGVLSLGGLPDGCREPLIEQPRHFPFLRAGGQILSELSHALPTITSNQGDDRADPRREGECHFQQVIQRSSGQLWLGLELPKMQEVQASTPQLS